MRGAKQEADVEPLRSNQLPGCEYELGWQLKWSGGLWQRDGTEMASPDCRSSDACPEPLVLLMADELPDGVARRRMISLQPRYSRCFSAQPRQTSQPPTFYSSMAPPCPPSPLKMRRQDLQPASIGFLYLALLLLPADVQRVTPHGAILSQPLKATTQA